MPVTTITGDIYRLEYINTVIQPKLKNGVTNVGRFARATANWVAECLCDFDLSSIPSGATVNSVTFRYNVVQFNTNGASLPDPTLNLREQTRTAWVDGANEPVYDTFSIPQNQPMPDVAWPASSVIGTEVINQAATGLVVLPSVGTLIPDLIQDWISGSKSNGGMVMTMNTNFFNAYLEVSGVELEIDFDGAAAERRIFIM